MLKSKERGASLPKDSIRKKENWIVVTIKEDLQEYESFEVTLDKRHIDMGRLIAKVVHVNKLLAAKKNISIEFKILNWME